MTVGLGAALVLERESQLTVERTGVEKHDYVVRGYPRLGRGWDNKGDFARATTGHPRTGGRRLLDAASGACPSLAKPHDLRFEIKGAGKGGD